MKKMMTILAAIVLMAFALCGCGAPKEAPSHSARTAEDEIAFTTSVAEATAETIELESTEEISSEIEDDPLWPTTHWLADLLPHPDYITEVKIKVDRPDNFQAYVTNLSVKDFGDYKYQLTVCGWSTVLTSTDDMFIADHEDGVHRVGIQINDPFTNQTYIHIWEVG